MKYKDLTDEQRKDYHRKKHKEYRDRNRESYRIKMKIAHKKFLDNQKNKEKYNQRNNIYNSVNSLLRKGIIKKDKCIFCENYNTESHHQDYTKPLDVIWMCKHCHEIFHQLIHQLIKKQRK